MYPRIIYLRGLIAFTVVGVTWWLALKGSGIASEWEAVFLAVVGYYFSDRTVEDRIAQDETAFDWPSEARIEILVQFLLAWFMVAGTLLIFVYPSFKDTASGVWIGAVVLAVGFYFKESSVLAIRRMHHVFGATLAITVTVLTIPLLISANRFANQNSKPLTMPVQWVGLVFIIVVFYFKQSRQGLDGDKQVASVK